MAQIFLLSGLIAVPSAARPWEECPDTAEGIASCVPGRAWEEELLEGLLHLIRVLPPSFWSERYTLLLRKPAKESAGRTDPRRGALEIHDSNFGGDTFLHELGHLLDQLGTGDLDASPDWRRLHGWSRDSTASTGWRKIGRDCTRGYGTVYGLPGQEFADEQWNYVRFGCDFRRCSRAYYEHLKLLYGGFCYCSRDPSCRNANPFQ